MMPKEKQSHFDKNQAVALYYDGYRPPHVSAKGVGDLADKILNIAKKHDVFLHKDAQLTRSLSALDIGDEIPERLYIAIAKIIAFVYMLDGKFPKKWKQKHKGRPIKNLDHKS